MVTEPSVLRSGPSPRAIAKATAAAAAVAVVVLIIAVLPAEYGVDPTGVGARLGLMALSSPISVSESVAAGTGDANVPVQAGPVANYGAPYRADAVDLILGPYEYVEYKYRLEKGASMLYSWAATADLVHDLHGEPDGDPADGSGGDEESFDKQTRRRADGAFTAPFSGIHGWFWENTGPEAVTIRMTTSGFYSSALEIRSNRTRTPHPLTSLEDITFSTERDK